VQAIFFPFKSSIDLIDESEWIHTIKGRYERLLLEIFA